MHFSSSFYFAGYLSWRVSVSLFRFTCYLQAPFSNLHVLYRLAFSIGMLFTGYLIWFPCYLQAPCAISILFTGSRFRFPCYLRATFFDLHVINRLPLSISKLFTGCLFRFAYYLKAPFFNLHVIFSFPFNFHVIYKLPFFNLHVAYSLPFWIYMLFTVFWQPPCIKYTCYLQVFRLNCNNFQAVCSICRNGLFDLSPLLWKICGVFSIIYMFHLKFLHVFAWKHRKGKKSCKLFFTVSFWLFTC